MIDKVESPVVSVIIPTYNRVHMLGRAIQSVLSQTYRSFELIVVDDASTDNTGEVVKGFDDRIRYICHDENKGAAAARDTGIKAARGEYIAFLDSDDEWLPEKLERQIKAFESSGPQVGVIYARAITVIQSGEVMTDYMVPRLRGHIFGELLLSNQIRGGTSSVIVKRDHLKEIGGFDQVLPSCSDWDLWLRFAKVYQFDFVDVPLLKIYIHGYQMTTNAAAMARDREKFLLKYQKLYGRDKQLLSRQQRYLGSMYCQAGDLRRGRHWFLESISTDPLNLTSYLYLGVSLLGARFYDWSARLRKRNDPYVKVSHHRMPPYGSS